MSVTTSTAPSATPGSAFSTIMSSAIGVVSAKVDHWSDRLEAIGTGGVTDTVTDTVDEVADEAAAGGGARRQAGVRGAQAGLEGKNPVWAAIKGAWTGGNTLVKASVVTAGVGLVLLLLVSPVLALVFLLSALVVAAITKARSAGEDAPRS